jgi:hypothetical protein
MLKINCIGMQAIINHFYITWYLTDLIDYITCYEFNKTSRKHILERRVVKGCDQRVYGLFVFYLIEFKFKEK